MALNDRIIGVQAFMKMLDISSRTTFDKYAKREGFPETLEWPPQTRSRGWRLSEAEAYVNGLMESARPWAEVAASQEGAHAE